MLLSKKKNIDSVFEEYVLENYKFITCSSKITLRIIIRISESYKKFYIVKEKFF